MVSFFHEHFTEKVIVKNVEYITHNSHWVFCKQKLLTVIKSGPR